MRILKKGIFLLLLLAFACKSETAYTPKPRAYPRVEYPEKAYQVFDKTECPFQFTYPVYAEISQQEDPTGNNPRHPCWFNIYYPDYDASIHCNYFPIRDRKEFDDLIRDSYTIANQINQRSHYMEEARVVNSSGVSGIILEFTGPAASPMQFFLTDTTRHFFRGALYFNTQARPDSLAPIAEFIKQDIAEAINSFQWEED